MTRSILGLAAVVLAVIVSAAGAWFHGAGTVRAPEPARLTQVLTGSNGASGAAYFPSTQAATTVIKWPGTYVANTTLVAGQPCSTTDLPAWADATKVIVATGNYRKCI